MAQDLHTRLVQKVYTLVKQDDDKAMILRTTL